MATWTTIPNTSIETDKPMRAVDGRALRDNPIAIAEGASGAPKIESAAINTNAVTTTKIANSAVTNAKLATNSVTNNKILSGTILSGSLKIRSDVFAVSTVASEILVDISSVGGPIINVAYSLDGGDWPDSMTIRTTGATTSVYIIFAGATTTNEGDLIVNHISST